MLDTDQLRSFLAIVDSGSFTRAAERVNKTQSAVSMHVRRLEEQLGCALFVKDGRGSKLTAEGGTLIDFARRMMQVEAGALAALSRKALKGVVRLGIPDDYAEAFLADILTRYHKHHPAVEISVVCENSVELLALLRANGLDLALVTEVAGASDIEIIREEPLVWAAAKRFHPDESAPLPLAMGSQNCIWRREAEIALRTSPARATRVLFYSKNYSAMASVVRAGLAATVIPLGMVGQDMRVLGAECGLPRLPDSRMGLVRATGVASPEALALAEAIRATVTEARREAA